MPTNWLKATINLSRALDELIELIEDGELQSLWYNFQETLQFYICDECKYLESNIEFFTTERHNVYFVIDINAKSPWELEMIHNNNFHRVFSNDGDLLIDNEVFH